jgi:hypothetical protein
LLPFLHTITPAIFILLVRKNYFNLDLYFLL